MVQTNQEQQNLQDLIAALTATVVDQLGPELIQNPQLADAVTQKIEDKIAQVVNAEAQTPNSPDGGLAELVGIGNEAAKKLGKTKLPQGVENYDETVASGRILAIADLYYLYVHEIAGVFHAVNKLKELFNAGAVRLSNGDGAYGLYRFDRRKILRYTKKERLQAYRRALGYTKVQLMPDAKANVEFHSLMTHFINSVAQFWRDKRISDVIRERAYDPSFGSIATVRRSGLDFRNNLKWSSYGHISVLRIEVMQLLHEAFTILGADDVLKLYGADNAWDTVEEIMSRYFRKNVNASKRHRMAVTGREIIRWLAQPYILNNNRADFETFLRRIADPAEEWITSAETLGVARRTNEKRIVTLQNRQQSRNGHKKLRSIS